MRSRWTVALLGLAMLGGVGRASAQTDSTTNLHDPEGLVREQTAVRRAEIVQGILSMRALASGREFGPALRSSLSQQLMSLPLDRLEAFYNAGGLGDIEAAAGDVVPNAIGDADSDLVFTPVAPCRIIDTRSAAAGLLVAGAPRNFLVRSATGFATQGGSATDCGIRGTATSVEMNFVAVGPQGPGNLRAYPFGSAAPNASVLNYANVAGLNIANGIAQPVCNPAAATCTSDLTVRADVSSTHLVVDVVGYYNRVAASQQNAASFNLVLVNSTSQAFLAGLNNVAIEAGETVRVTAGFGVWAGSTTQGAACGGGCNEFRGEIAACYRTAGGGTPTVGNHTFIWDTAANFAGGAVTARRGGMFAQSVFTIAAAGNYDFGICGRRDTTSATDADWNIYYPNVVLSRP